MKILSIIVEVLVSPFTFLFRTKAQKNNSSNKTNIFIAALVAILITAILIFIYYYERIFFKW